MNTRLLSQIIAPLAVVILASSCGKGSAVDLESESDALTTQEGQLTGVLMNPEDSLKAWQLQFGVSNASVVSSGGGVSSTVLPSSSAQVLPSSSGGAPLSSSTPGLLSSSATGLSSSGGTLLSSSVAVPLSSSRPLSSSTVVLLSSSAGLLSSSVTVLPSSSAGGLLSSSGGGAGGGACVEGAKVLTACGTFDTAGAVCVKISGNIAGWNSSNTDGRSYSVNGGAVTAGASTIAGSPVTAMADGFVYLNFTAGTFTWAGCSSWK